MSGGADPTDPVSDPVSDPAAGVPFPPLADAAAYRPTQLDLRADTGVRAAWLDVFRTHFVSLLTEFRREADERGADAAETDTTARGVYEAFNWWLDGAAHDVDLSRSGNVLDICAVREVFLRDAGIVDPYRLAKHEAVGGALRLLPARLAELDGLHGLAGVTQATEVIRGVFAGNVFDLGAAATVERFAGRAVDFAAVVAELKPRPWRVDELDAWLERLRGPAHRHAVLFVDNAGPDVLLGMLPLGRFLLQRGTRVTLAANTTPSLNDVTHAELVEQLADVAGFDKVVGEALSDGRLAAVASGCATPLIDLSRVSPQLAAAAADADLVVLEGMGRSLESNFDAAFACDCLRLAMLKDTLFAGPLLGGELYDLVCRFAPSATPRR